MQALSGQNYTCDRFPHPTWIDSKGQKHCEQPKELVDLTEGEKLLLQQVSPCENMRQINVKELM